MHATLRPVGALIVGLVLLGVVAPAHATDPVPAPEAGPQWTVVVDPLTFALGFAHVQVERAVSPHVSIYVGPHARLFDSLLADDKEDFLGFGLEAGVRYFFSPTAPEGAWVGVRGVAAYLTADVGDDNKTALGGYGSALVGYTWLPTDWLVLSGGGGAQYLHYTIAGLGPKMFFVALHTAAGVAF
jgi:hypothetical protein